MAQMRHTKFFSLIVMLCAGNILPKLQMLKTTHGDTLKFTRKFNRIVGRYFPIAVV